MRCFMKLRPGYHALTTAILLRTTHHWLQHCGSSDTAAHEPISGNDGLPKRSRRPIANVWRRASVNGGFYPLKLCPEKTMSESGSGWCSGNE